MTEEIKVKVREELGRVSGIFMSQGDTRAGDIVMPTEQLIESAERIDAIIDQAIQQERERLVVEIKKVEIERAHTYASENADVYRAYDSGQEAMKNRIITLISPIGEKE